MEEDQMNLIDRQNGCAARHVSLFGPAFHIVRAFAGGFVAGRRPAEDGGPGVFRISLPGK